MGKRATMGSSVIVVDSGPSCRSRSRTRTRALDPAPAVTVVKIERPAHPQGRGRYDDHRDERARRTPDDWREMEDNREVYMAKHSAQYIQRNEPNNRRKRTKQQ